MSEIESEQFKSAEEEEAARAFERQPDAEQTIETEKRKPPFDALTNQYHLDRAQELIGKFNLEAQGFSAEDLLQHSAKYQRIVERFFASQGYQDRLAGERRWTKGLREMPQYWHPQALSVANPERIDYILKSLGLEQIAEKVGRENLIRFLRETPRNIPPEG